MEVLKIETFDDAISFIQFARMMKDDLPDGQWEGLKEIIIDYKESYGKVTAEWSDDAKASFTEEIRENFEYWL